MVELKESCLLAIVEDDEAEASVLKSHFSRFAQEHKVSFHVDVYPSAEAFLTNYRPKYDLVLMDIGLPRISGMEAAARMRELDTSVMLIFVTNLAQYAVQGYEVNAFDFIMKPVPYAAFALKMQRAMKSLQLHRNPEILITQGDTMFRIPSSHIRYVEISGHDIRYHTIDGTLETYGSLKQVESELNCESFVRCNNCYLVNLSHVKSVSGETVALTNGEALKMSRMKRKPFVQALNQYLGGLA